MATAVELVALLVLVVLNTAVAALTTRFLRVRLHTTWGSALYTALLVPGILFVLTLGFDVVVRLLPNLGSPTAVLGVSVVLPMALGVTFDYVWMPAPGEVDLPEARERERERERRRSQPFRRN